MKNTLPFPPRIIFGYKNLETVFTSGDLSRICDISRSSAKFYVNKMVELRIIAKVPHKRLYQKYPNSLAFSSWLKDLIKLAIEPLEMGEISVPPIEDEDEG